MRLERITDTKNKIYKKALELYSASFPSYEQREPTSQAKILSDEEYHFNLIYDGDIYVGLILYWETKDFIYVEHFCILPEMRNKKYGQKVLELLSHRGKIVILEIDPPIDTIAARRKGFYERCGFAENPYTHTHPPYHKKNRGHDLVIMSYPNKITQSEYDAFTHYLKNRVMADVFS